MQLTIFVLGLDLPVPLDVAPDTTVEKLSFDIQNAVGIPVCEQFLEHNGNQIYRGLLNSSELGVKDQDFIVVKQIPLQYPSVAAIPAELTANPESLVHLASRDKRIINLFFQEETEATAGRAEALATLDVPTVRKYMMASMMNQFNTARAASVPQQQPMEDPYDIEYQRKLEEKIRQDNVLQNMEAAIEHLPESFGSVTMLYINIEVNSHPVKAFVDSGAQMTIMSKACADRTNITRLMDTRYRGEARGVGTAKILGRVHIAQMRFGTAATASVLPISITILDTNDMDFLFGLDNLKRYRCVIDLGKNVLRIDGAGGEEEVEFLPESEIPKMDHQKDDQKSEKMSDDKENGKGSVGSHSAAAQEK